MASCTPVAEISILHPLLRVIGVPLLVLSSGITHAFAQSYPTKPIVPFKPGGLQASHRIAAGKSHESSPTRAPAARRMRSATDTE